MQLSLGNFKINARPTTIIGALALTGAISSVLLNPGRPVVEKATLTVPMLPPTFDGLTIAHISDFHVDEWLKGERLFTAMRKTNALNADMIVITGDFTSDIPDDIANDITEGLKLLQAHEGVYAVLGNHDYWVDGDAVATAVRKSGITLLSNAHKTIERDGQSLYIAGVDDIYEEQHDLDAALAGIPAEACTLLLAHEPDFADTVIADGRVNVQFSGHSHGGQFRLPVLGPPWLPPMGRRYVAGAYQIGNFSLYVNRGLGVTGIAARINCPPEITHITLKRA